MSDPLAIKKNLVFKTRTIKTHRFTRFVALEYFNVRNSSRSYFSVNLWLSEMPTQCHMMWFKTYSSVLGKAIVKDCYLKLCFKIWRILVLPPAWHCPVRSFLSCWSQHASELSGVIPLKSVVVLYLPRLWLFSMLSDEMHLFFTLSISHAKPIFFFSPWWQWEVTYMHEHLVCHW